MTDGKTRLIGITGIGGLGKSTLAAKIYDEDTTAFDDKVWADISRIGFTELARRVLFKFGVSPETIEAIPEQSLGDALVNHLRQGRYLLVMDNLETLLQSDDGNNKNTSIHDESYRQFFYGWLECGGKSVVLVTTRERLDLPPIRCQWLSLPGLEPVEGATLLQALGIRGTEEEFVEFSQKVEGHPLLLTLVAGFLLEEEEVDPQIRYLQRYGLADISHLLTDENLKGLHRGTVDIWMRRVLDESFGRISQRMQQLVLGVCVYRIPFNSAMALAQIHSFSFERDLEVSQPQNKQERSSLDSSLDSPDSLSPPFEGGLGGSKRDNLDTKSIEKDLRQLVRRSLLKEERDKDGGRWFKFQPLIQEYAKYKAGELTQAHQRAINYYLLNLKKRPWQIIEDVAEYLEIFYHWCELKQYITAFDILHGCKNFLELQGYYSILIELYGQLVRDWKPNNNETYKLSAVLIYLGHARHSLGQYQHAKNCYFESLEIAQKIGNLKSEIHSLLGLSNVYHDLQQPDQVAKYSQDALEKARKIGDIRGMIGALNSLGNSYFSLGEFEQAIEYYQLILSIVNCKDKVDVLNNLGINYRYLGKYKKSIIHYDWAIKIAQNIGYIKGEANAWSNLGLTYAKLGQKLEAIAAYQKARELDQAINSRGRCSKLQQFN